MHAGEQGEPLVYPRRLGDNQRDIANRYLFSLAPEDRQPILDELEGRFQAELKGMKPVYDEISFLIRLCELMKSGEFVPNLGIKVRDARRVREAHRQQALRYDTATEPKETDEQRRKRMALAKERMDEMRKALGMPLNKGPLSEANET
jgi:hypothetical protein